MEKVTVQVPALYGDHHVTAVRAMLLGMPGVRDVYATSSFQIVEVDYDEAHLSPEDIVSVLDQAGYLGEMELPQETGRSMVHEERSEAFFRHTVAHANTGRVISFGQQVPATGRSLWPCPGIGPLERSQKELENG
jgi:copper chaperone CopZ